MEVTDLQPKMDFFGGVELLTTTKRDLITHTYTNTHTYCDSHFGFVPLFRQNLCWNASLCITHAHSHTHTRKRKSHLVSLWHTLTPSQHNLTQISHLLMTVTNASWLHWMAYIVSHTRLHSQHTHLHTHTRARSTKMLITFIWLCVSVIKTDPTDTGGMNRATVCVFSSSAFRCSHAFTNTHIHTHTVSLSLSLSRTNTLVPSTSTSEGNNIAVFRGAMCSHVHTNKAILCCSNMLMAYV